MAIKWVNGDKKGQVEHVGTTLTGILEHYCGHDQYTDYAEVFEDGKVKQVYVGSGYCQSNYIDAEVVQDATQEVIIAAKEYKKQLYLKQEALKYADNTVRTIGQVKKGDKMVIVKGRKHPKGMVGIAFWVGPTQFGKSIGFKLEGKEGKNDLAYWTAFDNAEKVLTEKEEKELQEAELVLQTA